MYAYRKFTTFEKLVEFSNRANMQGWRLHSWQEEYDSNADGYTIIHAIFEQDRRCKNVRPLPEV